MQGQLHVTGRNECIFGIWSGENQPLIIEHISKDDEFWKAKMEKKIVNFYLKCLLPEIIDSRQIRGMALRDLTLEDINVTTTTKSTTATTTTNNNNNETINSIHPTYTTTSSAQNNTVKSKNIPVEAESSTQHKYYDSRIQPFELQPGYLNFRDETLISDDTDIEAESNIQHEEYDVRIELQPRYLDFNEY